MRLSEILNESVTFGVATLKSIGGKQYYTDPFSKEIESECFVCDGSGKESHRAYRDDEGKEHPAQSWECGMCKGAGKVKDFKSDAPELNVANGNAMEIQRMLGLDPDYSGAIKNADIPAFRRQLIKIKNGDMSSHVVEPKKEVGKMKAYTDDKGQSRIGRGATMHDMGRSHSQVERYIDSLLSIMDFAQKNNLDVTWA
jgi:hypothetical protein